MKIQNGAISVVLASYNGEKYIEAQLRSIVQQTHCVSEIVICDDCSTDRTVLLASNLLKECEIPYKFVMHDRNQGVVSSFMDAIRACNGEIVFLADQDDVWKPNKVERFVNKFGENEKCVLCFSDAELVDASLNSMGMTLWKSIDFYNKCRSKSDFVNELLKRNVFTGMSMAFKRKEILNNLFFSENMLHDEMFGWTALLNYDVIGINESLALYRQHSKNVKGIKRRSFWNVRGNIKHLIKESNKKYYKKFKDVFEYMKAEQSPLIKGYVSQAVDFYKWKTDLAKNGRIKGLCQVFYHLIHGSYKKFTSNSDHAFIKDLYVCLW